MTAPGTNELPGYLVPSSCSGTESNSHPSPNTGLYTIPSGHSWDDCWELAADLHIEVNTSPEEIVAVACLALREYGIGDSLESAITDLLTSLSDYYQSLESREANLAPSAIEDLHTLRHLIRVSSAAARGR